MTATATFAAPSAISKAAVARAVVAQRIAAAGVLRAQNLFSRFARIDNVDAMRGMAALRSSCVDAIITDPPYGVDMAAWDGEVPGVAVWEQAIRVLIPGAYAVVAAAPRTYHLTAAAMEAAGFIVRDQLIWRYARSFPGAKSLGGEWRSGLKTNQEPWVVAQKPLEPGLTLRDNWAIHGVGGVRTGATGGGVPWKTNVLECDKPRTAERELGTVPGKRYGIAAAKASGAWSNSSRVANQHPTLKPLPLMRSIVRAFTPDQGLVLDPFMGSGTTLMAAAAEGHSLIGFDIDHGYWDLACDRIGWALDYPHLVPAGV